MKKLLLVLFFFVSIVSYGQKYISKKQFINTINNQLIETNNHLFITIDGDKIQFTNKSGEKILLEYKMGETKKEDEIIKYSLVDIDDNIKIKKLVRKSFDSFTNKGSKLIYELTPVD
jgi:hypothetical protein